MSRDRDFLRHTVATLAYRGGKAVRGADESFSDFRVAEGSRTPGEILAHIGDLLDWALSMAKGQREWHDSKPQPWWKDVERFHVALETFDAFLASDAPLAVSPEKLFQAPIADALSHVGQIAMLRRLAGCRIKAENYFRAEISAGRVGADQVAPSIEFD